MRSSGTWQREPPTSLTTTSRRHRCCSGFFFEQYSHEPHIAVARFWLAIAKHTPGQEELEAKHRGGSAALEAMERHLASNKYLVNNHYTIADIALYAYTHVADDGRLRSEGIKSIKSWLKRVARQPGYVPMET